MRARTPNFRTLFSSLTILSCWMIWSLSPVLGASTEEKPEKSGGKISSTSLLSSKIATNPSCRSEVTQICKSDRRNDVVSLTDLEALDCILNQRRDQGGEITNDCNHALWLYRKALMEGGFLDEIDPSCSEEIKSSDCYMKSSHDKSYKLINCVIENKDKLKTALCIESVTILERVVFSDYELIERFATTCQPDIQKYSCGRNDVDKHGGQPKVLPMTQGGTIECLSGHIRELAEGCAFEILRVAELQADDYHLDRALFFACRDDRERLCKGISSGNGKVYKCLLQNKMDKEMSSECREQLYRRQKMGWQDYKATGIVFSCKNEIKKNTCRKGASESDKHVRLSQILLCLENAAHTGQEINAECVEEMRQHRKSLLEDHRVTPELLTDCAGDMKKLCNRAKSLNQKTIHCLMEHALVPEREFRISTGCRARLEDLVKIADVSEDWRVDPVLKENCQPVVASSSCRDVGPNHIMDCLMHLLTSDVSTGADAHAMTDDCESTLLQIQYFVARDFSMDSGLFEDCSADAKEVCGVTQKWNEDQPRRGPLVLSCLYRNIEGEDGKKVRVSQKCAERVRETMRRRSLSVNFIPEIEEFCLEDLAELCTNQVRKGEEMACLQKNMDHISPECKAAVTNFTVAELKDPSIDPSFWKYCRDIVESKCSGGAAKNEISKSDESKKSDEADDESMMECMVKLKPEIKNKKCKASIDHLQLVQLKDIRFSPKFKAMCNSDVIRWCKKNSASQLLACLSEHIRNDTINESTQSISKGCRRQVKYMILSKVQLENAQVDPGTIYSLCGNYVKQFCANVSPGGGRIFECLRSNKEEIRDTACYDALFHLEQDVNNDVSLDVLLKRECEAEIKEFCYANSMTSQNPTHSDLFDCLRLNSMKEGFNQARCGRVLRNRMLEQISDYRLNPNLRKACGLDVPKFCKNMQAGEGKIITCLQKEFAMPGNRLSPTCKTHLEGLMEAAAMTDVRLDYPLYKFCKEEIGSNCKYEGDLAGGDGGKVEECLKNLFHIKKLSGTCREQVQLLIQSTQIDIHVDPALNRACAIDLLMRCDGVPPGDGRLIGCLLNELEREKIGGIPRLRTQCKDLLKVRYELFQLAGSPLKMDSLEDLYSHVSVSPHRNYFLIVAMSMVGVIFIFGLFCGRATKRKAAAKDK